MKTQNNADEVIHAITQLSKPRRRCAVAEHEHSLVSVITKQVTQREFTMIAGHANEVLTSVHYEQCLYCSSCGYSQQINTVKVEKGTVNG